MKKAISLLVFCSLALTALAQPYLFNRAPLEPSPYAELPLGAIRPEGWLKEQLQRQASGLTGHLDEVYPEVMGPDNAWLGGDGDAWERGPYWIDGLLPLAYILDDGALKEKAQKWVEAMLASQQEDGYFGPAEDHPFVYGLQRGSSHDWWPKMVALKILRQYYMATQDRRIIDLMRRYFLYQRSTLPEKPLDHWTDWGKWRGADNLEIVYWLYNITGDRFLLDLGETLHGQTAPWTGYFLDGSIFTEPFSLHCVNLAQGFKAPMVHWQFSRDEGEYMAPKTAVERIRTTICLPTGLWAGDELINRGNPTRGSELCTAVEMMFSLEEMLRISGDTFWADYLERVAFNALPTQATDDYMGKQYYQQVNQVACTRDWRLFSTPHEDTDLVFGTLNGYPCCLSNMHQGWPKFTQNLWYATADDGLAALVYAPCTVTAKAGGVTVRVTETTAYPFRNRIVFKVDFPDKGVKSARFPLMLRIPAWAEGATVTVNGKPSSGVAEAGRVLRLETEWRKGAEIVLTLPMEVRTEEWYDRAWTLSRGPLLYALRMNETWTEKRFEGADHWFGKTYREVTSDTPWNYCLMRDSFRPEDCRVTETPMAAYPWTLADAPVHITVPARTLPHWTVPENIAYFTEDGLDYGEETRIELIPYGCTTLRIAAFPTRAVPWDLDYKK
ncbi:MAG: glycoside hydrolase family 127 protein [Bacteroidales bacterium]|nr:glycoside hydrolase family 127 protein [Bacteroidales bacterium]